MLLLFYTISIAENYFTVTGPGTRIWTCSSGVHCTQRPLYVSYDVSAKVLNMATQLLKRAGEHDVKVAGTEVEVAWTLIASLMSLGPNFVRPHFPQLLVLWRNALPKPTSKDSASNASLAGCIWRLRSAWSLGGVEETSGLRRHRDQYLIVSESKC